MEGERAAWDVLQGIPQGICIGSMLGASLGKVKAFPVQYKIRLLRCILMVIHLK